MKRIDSMRLPIINYAIPVLNEEGRIANCLEAIKQQNYPELKKEIIVMDGGSTDQTVIIAKSYGACVYPNSSKLAEPGLAKAYKKAKGDYMVYMAADNILIDKNWTLKMIQPFLDNPKQILSSFSKVINDPNDNIWNKYFNEDQDPFSAFVFGNASHPDKYKRMYDVEIKRNNYTVYKYPIDKFPLIALAQGTMLKTGIPRDKDAEYDDILPLLLLVKSGGKIAYIKDTGLYHYSVKGFWHIVNKFKYRIYNSMKTNSYDVRARYMSPARKLRQYLFIPYSMTIFLPFIHGLYLAISKRKFYMLLHPILCFIIGYYIITTFIQVKLWGK